MTFLNDTWYSVFLLRQKMRLNPWPKVQQSGFVWGNGLYQPGRFYFSGFRKAQDVQLFSGGPLQIGPRECGEKIANFGTGHFPIKIYFFALWVKGLTSFFILEGQLSTQRHTERSYLWRWPLFRSFLGGLHALILIFDPSILYYLTPNRQ